MSSNNFVRKNLLSAVLCTLAVTGAAGAAAADATPPANVVVPGTRIFPESLTSTKDGTIIIGSVGASTIFKAAPNTVMSAAWIMPGTDGMQSIFGVLADEASNTLWACSGSAGGAPGGAPPAPGGLYAFDLKTGASKGHYQMPMAGGFCNDIAVAADGTVYASDTSNMAVARLAKGATALEMWIGNGAFGPAGGIVDGIAIVGGRVMVNTLRTNKIFAVAVAANGSAGKVTELVLDRAIEGPDGMRSYGTNELLVAEGGGGGRLSRITIEGDNGKVVTVKAGYPDGAVAVTVVGSTAYVLEGQLSGMRAAPDAKAVAKPFQATAVSLSKP